ncbi:hypothetical protein N7495_000169 [Penicillium taxi]|uniref:uncharacterized protein n=1 Tax=Penicillium taxi TaxID=168475 RepID=UPI002544DBB6|nr:uncharacterized protein N7495_000169 [Penicillium taxi]KAJ5907487.1 hypothetical protein N7495_000169 [Penicillium taxi]
MGLGGHGNPDSPPLRPSPPRRLSETSAATTLAFFKQQSPPEPRQTTLPQASQPPVPPPIHMHQQHHPQPSQLQHQLQQQQQQQQQQQHQHQQQQQQQQQHQHQHHLSHQQQQQQHHHQQHHPLHHPHPAHPIVAHDHINGVGSIRRKQKYTIKNVEAWGERHGRPAAHDPSGRALWKRPSDSSLVYLTCPIQGCAKSDFVTLHGFMCHLTKKHKDRTLGSQSRALELCGIVYDPNAPLPPVSSTQRSSREESPLDQMTMEGDDSHLESESEESDERDEPYPVKRETIERSLPDADEPSLDTPPFPRPSMNMNGSTKHSISSLIDRTPELDHREILASLPSSDPAMTTQVATPVSMEQSVVPAKRKYEYTPPSEKENTEPEGSVE